MRKGGLIFTLDATTCDAIRCNAMLRYAMLCNYGAK